MSTALNSPDPSIPKPKYGPTREAAPRPIRKPLKMGLVRGIVVAVIAGGVLALTGAFGSDAAPLWLRLAYWIPVMLAGGLWGHLCARVIERWIDPDERPWLSVAALTLTITGPVCVLVWFITGLVFGPAFGETPYDLRTLPYLIAPVGIITATLSAVNVFLSRARPIETHAAAIGMAPAVFPDRLPPRLRGATIRAVQAEDHYLRIHTDRGSDLILMRLADALDELQGLEGAQIHRSWWVAREAVRDIARGDGRATLTLEGGLSAPVSRRYARALREAGWY